MPTKKKITYKSAIEELESIIADLEKEETMDMDAIAVKVKRASELLRWSEKRLHVIDKELEELINRTN